MASRDEILAAAQRHLNVDPSASTAVIAAAAGIGRATLHRHFASREALLHEIGTRSTDRWEASQHAAGMAEATASGDAVRIEACLRAMVSRFVADSDDFGFALTDSFMTTDDELVVRADEIFEREVAFYAAAQAAGVLRADVSPHWLGHAVYGLLVAAREALRNGDVARRALDDLVLSTFLAGSAAR